MDKALSVWKPSEHVIHWPCEGKPYSKTARATYYAAKSTLPAAYSLALFVVMPWLWALYFATQGKKPMVNGFFVILAIIGTAAFLAQWFFIQRYAHRLGSIAKQKHEWWRSSWAEYEAKCLAFRRRYSRTSPDGATDTVEQILAAAPVPPLVTWQLDGFLKMPLGDRAVLGTTDERALKSQADRVLAAMLVFFTELGGNTVATVSDVNGRRSVIACTMLHPNVQFWSIFKVSVVNGAVSCQLETGYQWWFEPHRLTDGTFYRGDMVRLKKVLRSFDPRGLYLYPLMVVFFPFGLIIFALMLWVGIKQWIHELRFRDQDAVYRAYVNPVAGDSADLALIQKIRTELGDYGARLNGDMKNDIEAFRQRVIAGAQASASTLDYFPA